MRKYRLCSWLTALLGIVAASAIMLPAASAVAATYGLAEGYTVVLFSWNHAGLSRNSGRLIGAEGTFEFEPSQPEASRVDVKLDANKISTGVPALDRLLRSVDFFDAVSNPAITFQSTAVRVTGERTGEITGDLTIHGTSKPVTLAVVWNFTGEHPLGLVNPGFAGKFVSGFSATAKILRSEWGLGRGAPLISDEVEIGIEVEAVRR